MQTFCVPTLSNVIINGICPINYRLSCKPKSMLLKDEVVFVFLIPNIITEVNPNMDFWSFQKIDHVNVPVGRSNNPKLAALLFEINGNGK